MQKTTLYPLLLDPSLHVKVWGGRKLETVMHKTLPTSEPYGESWEMHDSAKVANGALAGRTLGDLLPVYGAELLGTMNDPKAGMPLLVKLLDATDWLSVQVHPDDAQAAQLEGEPRGKTEAWYVIAAEPKSRLVIGVRTDSSREEVAEAIRANRLEDLLVYANVEAGDVLFIPAGTIHALGPGILVYEIQQSSDTTYRLYDWGRVGLDGKPRSLHIDKSLSVSRIGSLPSIHSSGGESAAAVDLIDSPYFRTTLHQHGDAKAALNTEGRVFHVLTCVEGEAKIAAGDYPVLTLETGRTVLIPAAVGRYTLTGKAKVLRSYQPA
ncbi:MAG: type I phosphomannose isomerase catalytic subunit [Chloroflexota bacterium]